MAEVVVGPTLGVVRFVSVRIEEVKKTFFLQLMALIFLGRGVFLGNKGTGYPPLTGVLSMETYAFNSFSVNQVRLPSPTP